MGLSKNNQVKFRIDDHTKMALERLLKNKKITLQSKMETLLKDSSMLKNAKTNNFIMYQF